MHILKAGREPFLAFLRNIPSQSVVLSISILTFMKADKLNSTFEKTTMLTVSCGLAITFFIAFFASMTLFKEHFFASYDKSLKNYHQLLKSNGIKGSKYHREYFKFIFKNHKLIAAESILITLIIFLGYVMVGILAIQSVINTADKIIK
ncbi:hypothetical protein NUT31_13510 [Aeromonas sp. BC14]|uniref:hypothetical protein n=1 Tax=Aeromonas hydrophila TaxID=644 RepID=UPI00227AC26F|nr:hypothetical protein [Aeromonas sp. BC14]WAF93409.1 hypothetical protein NUT31_13510 [Aeromonas sp. BC14]